MIKNVGYIDRLIRFVAIDLLLGFSYMGSDGDPVVLSSIAFVLSVIIALPLITAYSVVYQLLNISTRDLPIFDNQKSIKDS